MSLVSNVQDLATRIATETKALRTLINGNVGDLSALNTSAKTNLVAAINEAATSGEGGGGLAIDDTTASTGTVYSSSKTEDELAKRVRHDVAQTLGNPAMVQARANIDAASATDVGDTTVNFVNSFEAGLV